MRENTACGSRAGQPWNAQPLYERRRAVPSGSKYRTSRASRSRSIEPEMVRS